MTQITLTQYLRDRHKRYANEFSATIEANAKETVRRVNQLLRLFYAANPDAVSRSVNSGWRPPSVNVRVRGAAPQSHHLTARACDLSDDDEALDRWLLTKAGQQALIDCGLWLEGPSHTPRWCHVQIVPPRSGRRVFIP